MMHAAANFGSFTNNGKRGHFGKSQDRRAAETFLSSLEKIT
ncbi:hypothetical protein RLEG3_09625 (plasmid) [Rhizobium leguminosarum bv. trifolii WSM1689]|nr:hypothetical protein RLEG3_09625 [Rhizobium leguminosarum bv. trifolii WSM1689]